MAAAARSAEGTPEYELEKNINVIEVLRKQNENMKRTLNLKGLADAYVSGGQPAPRKKKKRQKRTPVSQTQAPDRQLRSTSILTTEISTEPEVVLNEPEGQEREVRKVTAMKSIWGRQNKPKLKLEINEYGQPCGKSATRFANFVGTQIRTKGFPVEFDDWRKVDLSKKLALWTEAKARSIRGKNNRAHHTQNHTSGSKSFAWIDTEMTEELKRRPHRHELFIETHRHRISGLPQEGSAKELQDEALKHPELLENGIKDGDLFAFVCGKEKNGYVCAVGLGPTPSDLELPGTQQYKSTKLQIAVEKCRVPNQKVEHLQDQMDDMKKQMAEMRQLFLSSQGQRDETNSTPAHESNSPHQNIRTREASNVEKGNAILEDVAESNASMQNDDTLTGRRIINVEKHNRQQGGGRDVILYSITRPLKVAVSKGTIQTTNPKAVVGVKDPKKTTKVPGGAGT